MSNTSPYSRKVRIVLREKLIACEEQNPNGAGFDLSTLNPLAKIPTLQLDDGTLLYDSVVIVEYLDALVASPRLIPDAILERALVRRWEALADGIADATVIAMLEGRRASTSRDAIVIERQHDKVRAALSVLERKLALDGALCGSMFTLADAAVVSALGYVALRAPQLLVGRDPTLEDYRLRLLQRPSVAETNPHPA